MSFIYYPSTYIGNIGTGEGKLVRGRGYRRGGSFTSMMDAAMGTLSQFNVVPQEAPAAIKGAVAEAEKSGQPITIPEDIGLNWGTAKYIGALGLKYGPQLWQTYRQLSYQPTIGERMLDTAIKTGSVIKDATSAAANVYGKVIGTVANSNVANIAADTALSIAPTLQNTKTGAIVGATAAAFKLGRDIWKNTNGTANPDPKLSNYLLQKQMTDMAERMQYGPEYFQMVRERNEKLEAEKKEEKAKKRMARIKRERREKRRNSKRHQAIKNISSII